MPFVGELNQKRLDSGQVEPLVEAEVVDLWDLVEMSRGDSFLGHLLGVFGLVKVLHVLDHAFPILDGLLPPFRQLLPNSTDLDLS